MAGIPANFLSGGSGLTPNGSAGSPSLKEILDSMNGEAGSQVVPQWRTGLAVATNVAVMPLAGYVIAVEGTTGTSTGAKSQVQNGSPAAGSVDVQYDANGVATLTFNGADAITECAVVLRPTGSGLLP